MAKPILLVNIPDFYTSVDCRNILDDLYKNPISKDYYIIAVMSNVKLDNLKFEVLNADLLNPLNIEELKSKINL